MSETKSFGASSVHKNIRVLAITTYYPQVHRGGVEAWVIHLVGE